MDLIESRVRGGVWRVLVLAEASPSVDVVTDGEVLADVSVARSGEGRWLVEVPLPARLIGDGVRTLLLRDARTGGTLGHLTVSAGLAGSEGLAAEVDLIREELELLKRAVRRLVAEGPSAGD